jgi:hypothetical protein
MESIPEVKEALAARSTTADLDALRSEGRRRVKVVRAEQVAEMISDAVREALADPRVMTRQQAERLVEQARAKQAARIEELEAELARVQGERDAAVAARGAGGGNSNEVALQLLQQFAAMQGQQANAQSGAMGAELSNAISQLSSTLNERLEKFGRKMGISGAVEAGPVSYEGLFKGEGEKLESNMDSIEVHKKKAGGIAANLEKLKKLKGGG